MNPFCELAVEQSLRLREGKVPSLPVEEITAISIGPAKAQDTLRTALAMGADKAIHVQVDESVDPEPLSVAKVLKAVAEREKSNLILLGKQSIDRDFGQTGQMLGGLLGWAQVWTTARFVEVGGLTGRLLVRLRWRLRRMRRSLLRRRLMVVYRQFPPNFLSSLPPI